MWTIFNTRCFHSLHRQALKAVQRVFAMMIFSQELQHVKTDICSCAVQMNGLQMIVRAHECVMDGFERFAQGHLITLFSATNYCGTANNAGECCHSNTGIVEGRSPDRYVMHQTCQSLNLEGRLIKLWHGMCMALVTSA